MRRVLQAVFGAALMACASPQSKTDGGTLGDAGHSRDGGVDSGTPGSGFSTAIPIHPTTGEAVGVGTFTPSSSAAVYFKLSGSAGDRLRILAMSTPDHTPFTSGYADTVLTVYDAQEKVIAENNDPVDGSSTDALLLTVLAATGDYYIRVVNCDGWERKTHCALPVPVVHPGFALYVDTVLNAFPSFTPESAEPNDASAAGAALVDASPALSVGAGTFQTASDVDSFGVDYASRTIAPDRRAMAYFIPVPAGATGSGSTAAPASVTLQNAMATLTLATYAPATQKRLFVPIEFATPYALAVKGPLLPGVNPFYFFLHGVTSRPLPAGDNHTFVTALALSPESDGRKFYVSGNLASVTQNFYKIPLPSGATSVDASCYGLQEGSGLTVELKLLQADGAAIADADFIEGATTVAGASNVALPVGATSLVVAVKWVSQAAEVTSTHFDCELFF